MDFEELRARIARVDADATDPDTRDALIRHFVAEAGPAAQSAAGWFERADNPRDVDLASELVAWVVFNALRLAELAPGGAPDLSDRLARLADRYVERRAKLSSGRPGGAVVALSKHAADRPPPARDAAPTGADVVAFPRRDL